MIDSDIVWHLQKNWEARAEWREKMLALDRRRFDPRVRRWIRASTLKIYFGAEKLFGRKVPLQFHIRSQAAVPGIILPVFLRSAPDVAVDRQIAE